MKLKCKEEIERAVGDIQALPRYIAKFLLDDRVSREKRSALTFVGAPGIQASIVCLLHGAFGEGDSLVYKILEVKEDHGLSDAGMVSVWAFLWWLDDTLEAEQEGILVETAKLLADELSRVVDHTAKGQPVTNEPMMVLSDLVHGGKMPRAWTFDNGVSYMVFSEGSLNKVIITHEGFTVIARRDVALDAPTRRGS